MSDPCNHGSSKSGAASERSDDELGQLSSKPGAHRRIVIAVSTLCIPRREDCFLLVWTPNLNVLSTLWTSNPERVQCSVHSNLILKHWKGRHAAILMMQIICKLFNIVIRIWCVSKRSNYKRDMEFFSRHTSQNCWCEVVLWNCAV